MRKGGRFAATSRVGEMAGSASRQCGDQWCVGMRCQAGDETCDIAQRAAGGVRSGALTPALVTQRAGPTSNVQPAMQMLRPASANMNRNGGLPVLTRPGASQTAACCRHDRRHKRFWRPNCTTLCRAARHACYHRCPRQRTNSAARCRGYTPKLEST